MSKTRLFNRLNNIFSDLQEDTTPLPEVPPSVNTLAWTWNCDLEGNYISCSQDVDTCLGINPASLIGQKVYDTYVHPDSINQFKNALNEELFPIELIINYQNIQNKAVPIRVTIIKKNGNNGNKPFFQGYNQSLPEVKEIKPILATPRILEESPSIRPADNRFFTSSKPKTLAGSTSLTELRPAIHTQSKEGKQETAYATPFSIMTDQLAVLEILRESERMGLSEDEQLLVQEVAKQLGLAIENAVLYNQRQDLLNETQRHALELQTAAEIARDTTSTLSLDVLLARIVQLLCERFGFYHAGIFLLDEERKFAHIQEATGEAGKEMKSRQHKLAVGSDSVVGNAAGSGEIFVVNDVVQNPNHFKNPLLPNTRSEIGIPLKAAGEVIGVLDIQSTQINAFQAEEISVFEILADQIATAIENARAYELAQQAFSDMKEADRLKSQFLANMSHELRTPLNSIIGFSRIIMKGIDGPINEIQYQDLEAIYNSGQHLLNLINDILDISKIEAGKMSLNFVDVNLGDLITSVLSTTVGLIKDKPIEIIQNTPQDLPLVLADETRIRQVLLNFLSNAAKFTDEGSIIVAAQPMINDQGVHEIMVTVTDSGPGISKEDQIKLFQRFSQVDDSPTRKTGGTGLGLFISKSMIELHHGRIGLLESKVDVGSTFFFTLPLKDQPQEQSLDQRVDENSRIILTIDDDLQILKMYERYLSNSGFDIHTLNQPHKALQIAKQIKPRAITLDVMMPEKDGWQVLHDLKRDPETKHIPVIICSILENVEKGFNLGAADYLVKPFLQEDILNALSRLNLDDDIHNILIIDDDPNSQKIIQSMLEKTSKFKVFIAANGNAGFELIENTQPDVILLDLFMPECNGFELIEKLNADEELSKIPIITISGGDLTSEQHQMLVESGNQVFTKGFINQNDLLEALEKALITL
jgi:signal transduction histidine kinase/DNA-binding response OmpR family regulator